MKKSIRLALCALVCLAACNKEVTETLQPVVVGPRMGGALPDDPALVAKVPLVVSAEFLKSEGLSAIKPRGPKVVDTDADGIADSNDACPTQKETVNGYQDSDGCPDTVPPAATPDITAPVIGITAPHNGTTVSGTVNITVNASDNIGVRSVSYTVDGISIGGSTAAPFTLSWNSSSVAAGSHTIVARAFDAAGNVGSATIMVSTSTTVLQPMVLPVSVSLTTPPIGNQGGEFSCVSWSVATARSIEQYYKTGAGSYAILSNIMSPEFLYNQAKASTECSSGSGLFTNLNLLKNVGVCTWQTMPYSDANGCSLLPGSEQMAEAAQFRINSFALVRNEDVIAIKTLLTQKHPVMAVTSVDNSFMSAGSGFIWRSFTSAYGTNHGYVICGYDDARHAYKVMNSWGTTWGDNGYSWIDYDFFGTLPGSVYVITGI